MSATAGASGPALLAGRYQVGPLVGVGATARVHRATDCRTGRAVAVKIYPPGSAEVTAPNRPPETDVLSGLRHAGLVCMLDAGSENGQPFVVMEFVDGHSLRQRILDGPLPADAVARLGREIAAALAHVHSRGVVHRDVKPGNVLLDRTGRARLTDFGIARMVDATRVTATGVVIGTAAYMAPEQVRGESVGPPADIFALGLVLLEAATGRREYEGGQVEVALARLHRPPRVPADLPVPLVSALRAMTALDPAARPTAADVVAALRPRGPVVRAVPPAPAPHPDSGVVYLVPLPSDGLSPPLYADRAPDRVRVVTAPVADASPTRHREPGRPRRRQPPDTTVSGRETGGSRLRARPLQNLGQGLSRAGEALRRVLHHVLLGEVRTRNTGGRPASSG